MLKNWYYPYYTNISQSWRQENHRIDVLKLKVTVTQRVMNHRLHCSRSPTPSLFIYQLDSCNLSDVKQHTYLGVTLTSSMSFSVHVNNICIKASEMLNFIKRNLHECSEDVKSIAYKSLFRPILEYSSPVWDLYLIKDI